MFNELELIMTYFKLKNNHLQCGLKISKLLRFGLAMTTLLVCSVVSAISLEGARAHIEEIFALQDTRDKTKADLAAQMVVEAAKINQRLTQGQLASWLGHCMVSAAPQVAYAPTSSPLAAFFIMQDVQFDIVLDKFVLTVLTFSTGNVGEKGLYFAMHPTGESVVADPSLTLTGIKLQRNKSGKKLSYVFKSEIPELIIRLNGQRQDIALGLFDTSTISKKQQEFLTKDMQDWEEVQQEIRDVAAASQLSFEDAVKDIMGEEKKPQSSKKKKRKHGKQ